MSDDKETAFVKVADKATNQKLDALSPATRFIVLRLYDLTRTFLTRDGGFSSPIVLLFDEKVDLIEQYTLNGDNSASRRQEVITHIAKHQPHAYAVVSEAWARAFDNEEEVREAIAENKSAGDYADKYEIYACYVEAKNGETVFSTANITRDSEGQADLDALDIFSRDAVNPSQLGAQGELTGCLIGRPNKNLH